MLKHFGSGPNNDTVLGDLAEQYRQKDNEMWYWRQVLKAIPISFWKEIRGHKKIAARALLTGWALWTLYVTTIFPVLTPYFFGGGFGVGFAPSDPIGTAWTVLSAPVGIQAGSNRPFSFVFAVALPFIAWALCGWLVARFHRAHQTGVILLFAGSIVLLELLLFGQFVLYVRPPAPWLYTFAGRLAAYVAASLLGILLGGGLFRDHSRRATS
jgi:hypothetical protein